MKTEADIHFIKTCKQEDNIPTFSKVKLSRKHDNKKFENCQICYENGIATQTSNKNKIKREIKQLTFKLKSTVNTILFNAFTYIQLNHVTKSRSKAVKKRHNQKPSKLRRINDCSSANDNSEFVISTVHTACPHIC